MPSILAPLYSDAKTRGWLSQLPATSPSWPDLDLPVAADLAALLRQLAFPEPDVADLLALAPNRERDPDLWWLLERTVAWLCQATGPEDEAACLPPMPASLGPVGRYFPAYVFVAMVPHTLALHQARGVDPEVSWATLADLGRHMARYRCGFGVGGMDPWPTRHLQGKLFELGRLQFERLRLTEQMAAAIRATGRSQSAGDVALAVHIPSRSGPIFPEACDESFARARRFFARHFPEDRFDIAICESWLLDPQLAEYLSPGTNIMRFQRRFQLAYRMDNPDQIQDFVFGRVYDSLSEMPTSTILERAIADHIRSGRRWCGGAGWLLI